jgi:phospholipase/carboxylesterase
MSAKLSTVDLGFVHLYEPPKEGEKLTLLLLHGTGGDENDLVPLGEALAPRAGVLSIRGKVLENGSPRFFRRLAFGVFDEEDLTFRTNELATFLEAASRRYGFDSQKLVAVGFSNGANIAASLLLRNPEALAGGILLRSMIPFTPERLPALARKPILMLSGDRDSIVPTDNAKRLAALFQQAGADVTLTLQNAGHALTKSDLITAQEWLTDHFPI